MLQRLRKLVELRLVLGRHDPEEVGQAHLLDRRVRFGPSWRTSPAIIYRDIQSLSTGCTPPSAAAAGGHFAHKLVRGGARGRLPGGPCRRRQPDGQVVV